MALTRQNAGMNTVEEARSRRADAMKLSTPDPDEIRFTREELEELDIAQYCQKLLERGQAAREPFETFDDAWDLYIGDHWPVNRSKWRSRITINKIRAFIHFMQAVMTDNKPRINVEPLVPGSEDAAMLLRKLVDRDWDENNMQDVLSLAVLYGLIWGTAFVKVTYNPLADNKRGKHEACAVVPYRIWVDPTATSVEDAEFIIHIEEKSLGWVDRNFPKKAKLVRKYRGATIAGGHRTGLQRDLIREDQNGQDKAGVSSPLLNMMAGGKEGAVAGIILPGQGELGRDHQDQDTIEVAEYWFRDETQEEYVRPKVDAQGNQVMEDVFDDDGFPVLEVASVNIAISPLDGLPFPMPVYKVKQKPVMIKDTRPKFPNGRLVIMAGPVVLRDIPNPFQTPGFPFAQWKDQDVGAFWGQGEPLALKDANIAINRIVSQVYDNLNLAGNVSWLVQKDSGLNPRSLRNQPAMIIPVDDVNGVKPLETKPIAPQFLELQSLLSGAMSEISGLEDSARGRLPGGNTAFATVDTLQESSAAIVRLKVRNMEKLITRIGQLRIALIQQYDGKHAPARPIREYVENTTALALLNPDKPEHEHEEGVDDQRAPVVPPSNDVAVKFTQYKPDQIQGQVEFRIVPDSSLSTSPAGMWNRYMDMYKNKLIDVVSFHERFKLDDYRLIIQRLITMQSAGAAAKANAKKGPPPKAQTTKQHNRPGANPAPQSHLPTRADNAAVR